MKWGIAILVLGLLFAGIFGDQWRETLFLLRSNEESVEDGLLSNRPPNNGGDRRSVGELLALMREYEDQWCEAGKSHQNFPEKRWKVVREWPLAEVELLCRSEEGCDWSDELFERWGMEAPQEAISFVLNLKIKYAEEYRKAQISLEGGPGEWAVQEVGMTLNAALAGWARRDPHAAWKAMSDSSGEIVKSEALDGYGYLAPIRIFEYLAQQDSTFAFEEFQRHEDPLFRGSMLKGIVHGLPSGTDWAALIRDVLSSNGSESRDALAVMRGGLLGRWMAEDAKEAERWFRGDEGMAISREVEETIANRWSDPFKADEYHEVVTEVKLTEVTLASAARHWAVSDFDGATSWLRDRPELVPEILEGENWLDPDGLGARESRAILVSCYPAKKREDLLDSYLSSKEVSDTLSLMIIGDDKHSMRKEIIELQVSDELGERIFQKLWSERNWMENDSASGGDPDPFANE